MERERDQVVGALFHLVANVDSSWDDADRPASAAAGPLSLGWRRNGQVCVHLNSYRTRSRDSSKTSPNLPLLGSFSPGGRRRRANSNKERDTPEQGETMAMRRGSWRSVAFAIGVRAGFPIAAAAAAAVRVLNEQQPIASAHNWRHFNEPQPANRLWICEHLADFATPLVRQQTSGF